MKFDSRSSSKTISPPAAIVSGQRLQLSTIRPDDTMPLSSPLWVMESRARLHTSGLKSLQELVPSQPSVKNPSSHFTRHTEVMLGKNGQMGKALGNPAFDDWKHDLPNWIFIDPLLQ